MSRSIHTKARGRQHFAAARDHRRLWGLVEGAVVDAFNMHPDYLTGKGRASAVGSITKRVVGQLVGHAKGAQQRGRRSDMSGDSRGSGVYVAKPEGAGWCYLPRTRFGALVVRLLQGVGA